MMHSQLSTQEVSINMAEKKQVPLRLSAKLYDALAAWARLDPEDLSNEACRLGTFCEPDSFVTSPILTSTL